MSLYLLANTFYDEQPSRLLIAEGVSSLLETFDGIIGESERATRRFLIKVMEPKSQKARSLPIHLLNEHTKPGEVEELASLVCKGGTWGLVTDAGLPCIADPGELLVRQLQKKGYTSIHAVGGASSFIMSLQLSGLSGQRFSFLGYLSCDLEKRKKAIKKSEEESYLEGSTQIAMETPYRTPHFFSLLLETLSQETMLCVSQEVGTPQAKIATRRVFEWKKQFFECGKVPTVFLWNKEKK